MIPSTSTRDAPCSVSSSIRVRMIRPLWSRGVGTSWRRTGMGGMASTISATDVVLRPSKKTRRARAAAASKAGRKVGKT